MELVVPISTFSPIKHVIVEDGSRVIVSYNDGRIVLYSKYLDLTVHHG